MRGPGNWEHLTLKCNKLSTHANKWDSETNSCVRLVRENQALRLSPLFYILLCMWNQNLSLQLRTPFWFDSLLLEVRNTWRRSTFAQHESSEYRLAPLRNVRGVFCLSMTSKLENVRPLRLLLTLLFVVRVLEGGGTVVLRPQQNSSGSEFKLLSCSGGLSCRNRPISQSSADGLHLKTILEVMYRIFRTTGCT